LTKFFLICTLFWVVVAVEVCACEVTDVEMYVAVTEGQAPTTSRTKIFLCVGSTSCWARVRWKAKEYGEDGEPKDGPFEVQIYDGTTVIWGPEQVHDVDPGWQQLVIEITGLTNPPAVHTLKAEVRRVDSGDWLPSNNCTVEFFQLQLSIYNGQGGVWVPDQDEETIGAFTSANLNDTDGDSLRDDLDDEVFASNKGRDEIDLMKLVLHRPGNATETAEGYVMLEIVKGPVAIWKYETKRVPVTVFEFSTGEFTSDTIEWWVEALAATSLQDIELKYKYKPTETSEWVCNDVVNATGIWATCTKVCSANKTAAEVDAFMGADYQNNGGGAKAGVDGVGGTGVWPVDPGPPVVQLPGNSILVEFTITPSDIATVPVNYTGGALAKPRFDVSRQVEGGGIYWPAGEGSPSFIAAADHCLYNHFPEEVGQDNELANDDGRDGDETDEPTGDGHMWSHDAPAIWGGVLRVVRFNFREFVRVKTSPSTGAGDPVDPGDASNNAVVGSRCSPHKEWHSKTTLGLVFTPNVIGTGNFTFAREALHTGTEITGTPLKTTVGSRHHGIMRGLEIADTAGGAAETVDLILIDDDGVSDDVLHNVAGVSEVGKFVGGAGPPPTKPTLVGDQTAYTGVGYFASRFDGEIAGPDGVSGETTAELAHEIDIAGSNPQSDPTDVTGRAFTLPAPLPITMTLGTITTVTINGARAEAEDNAGGNQTVTILLVDDDGVSDDVLHNFTETVPKLMKDGVAGTNVTAVKYGLLNAFNSTKATIASKANGEVIGPDGPSGETTAEIAYEIDMPWASNPQSPWVSATGPVYSRPAPAIGTNPIPIGGTSTVTMDEIYIEATGSTGNETFNVRVIDEDFTADDLLETITGVTIARPAGCFAGALIGPATPPVSGTLTNPAPGGEVKGPGGEPSGEKTAEIGYEIGTSGTNSATVDVTAN
jgi:hypothetical protein